SGPSTVTDERGAFTFGLDPGRCTITVRSGGFVDASRSISVSQTGAVTVDFILQIAGYSDAVTVTAPAGYLTPVISTATKTPTPLRDVPQSIGVVTRELITDQLM